MDFKLENILDAVNKAGFASQEELNAWVKAGRLLVGVQRLTVTNTVLDAQRAAQSAAIETQKNANAAQIATLQAQLAELIAE